MSRFVIVADDSRTVRKVVERTLTRAGYRVRLVSDGEEALAACRDERPDLLLVDVVMPRAGGVDVAQRLREMDGLRDVPVVLMTAREDGKLDHLVLESGAVDAITKPFGPEALRAVTARILERAPDSMRPYAASQPPPPPARGDSHRPSNAHHEAAGHLVTALGKLVRRFTGTSTPTDAQLHAELVREISPTAMQSLASRLLHAAQELPDNLALQGSIDHVPLVGVLQLLEQQRRSGVLLVRQESRRIAVCFRDGCIDLALGQGGEREFLLGRYFVERGWVTPELLDEHAATNGDGEWLGARLVAAAVVTREQLRDALVTQTSELLYEALRWKRGTFHWSHGAERPEANDARLRLPMVQILMEGLRRLDEWRLIEEQIRDFDMRLELRRDAVAMLATDSMTPEERTVLAAVDGQRTVRDVVEQTSMSSFDACNVLFRLMTAGLVTEGRDRAARNADGTSA
ncbi:MAG: response regulator [Polyangiales bacterium]